MNRHSRPTASLPVSVHYQLNRYAIAAGAAGVGILALALPAEAKIIYTPAHRFIGVNQTIPVDLNHDGKTDFSLQNVSNTFEGSGQGFLNALPAQPSNGVVGFGTSLFQRPYAFALRAGNRIGPRAQFVFGKYIYMLYANATHGCHGSWNDVKHRYLGVEFVVKGEIHYGWARLKTSCNPGSRKITALLTGYAYETIANKPIIAGATKGPDDAEPATSLNTPTPEPATLGMLALGERGLSIWRREEHE